MASSKVDTCLPETYFPQDGINNFFLGRVIAAPPGIGCVGRRARVHDPREDGTLTSLVATASVL